MCKYFVFNSILIQLLQVHLYVAGNEWDDTIS